MQAIAVVGRNWEIGRGRNCSFNLKADRERFRRLTVGSTVIMGRTTLLSLPKSSPLPNRNNIVLSRSVTSIPGTTVCMSIQETLAVAPTDSWVIGGESIYWGFLPYCTRVRLTLVDAEDKLADRFFPNLDMDPEWRHDLLSEEFCEDGITYRFVDYVKR